MRRTKHDPSTVPDLFTAADRARAGLVVCADWAAERHCLLDAVHLYALAGATAQLVALGDRALGGGWFHAALDAYRTIPAPERLIRLGDCAYAAAEFWIAIDAYAAAGATAKLVALGDRMAGEGQFFTALDAYSAAGATAQRLSLGDRALEAGDLDAACHAYSIGIRRIAVDPPAACDDCVYAEMALGIVREGAGAPCSPIRRMCVGDVRFPRGGDEVMVMLRMRAQHVREAGGTARLLALGNRAVEEGRLPTALAAYSAAGAAARLLALGETAYATGQVSLAAYCFHHALVLA